VTTVRSWLLYKKGQLLECELKKRLTLTMNFTYRAIALAFLASLVYAAPVDNEGGNSGVGGPVQRIGEPYVEVATTPPLPQQTPPPVLQDVQPQEPQEPQELLAPQQDIEPQETQEEQEELFDDIDDLQQNPFLE
jgi:hypothetical protein